MIFAFVSGVRSFNSIAKFLPFRSSPHTHNQFMSSHTSPKDPAQSHVNITLTPQPREPRSPRAEKWIAAGWVLILVNCAVNWWAILAYNVPIHPLWLVAPTIAFAALATALYIWRD